MPLTTQQRSRIARNKAAALGKLAARRASRAAAGKAKRAASISTKRGLAREIRDVSLAQIETKFFDVTKNIRENPTMITSQAYAVCGYVTTNAQEPGAGATTLSYGPQPITDLHLAKAFLPTSTGANAEITANMVAMAMEGRKCLPTFAQNAISITRNFQGVGSGPAPYILNSLLAGPVYCRAITVTSKGAAGISTVFDPELDLFKDANGMQFGVASVAASSNTVLTAEDLSTVVVNRDKYTVLNDQTRILYQPMTQDNLPTSHPVTSQSQNPTNVTMKIRHQIAEKKGGQLTYKGINRQFPQTGHRREYTFLHFWQPGNFDNANFAAIPTNIEIRMRPVSMFKDP